MKTALRLPRDLHSRLMEAAIERGHSLNAEMVRRLDESFSGKIDDERQLEINAVLKGLRDTIAEVARADNERDDAVRAMGQDLYVICNRTLPVIDDEERYRALIRMIGDVGVSMQAGDITDAQAKLRAALYVATDFAHGARTRLDTKP